MFHECRVVRIGLVIILLHSLWAWFGGNGFERNYLKSVRDRSLDGTSVDIAVEYDKSISLVIGDFTMIDRGRQMVITKQVSL